MSDRYISTSSDEGEYNANIGNIGCISNEVIELIGGKWSLTVLLNLSDVPVRFNQLHRNIPTISRRHLTKTLRHLEWNGMIDRTVYDTIPPQVEYRITALGKSLSEPLWALSDWAVSHRDAINSARGNFKSLESSEIELRTLEDFRFIQACC